MTAGDEMWRRENDEQCRVASAAVLVAFLASKKSWAFLVLEKLSTLKMPSTLLNINVSVNWLSFRHSVSIAPIHCAHEMKFAQCDIALR